MNGSRCASSVGRLWLAKNSKRMRGKKNLGGKDAACVCSHLDHILGGWWSWPPGRLTGGCEDPAPRPLIGRNQTQSLRPNLSVLHTRTHTHTYFVATFYLYPVTHSNFMQNMQKCFKCQKKLKNVRQLCDGELSDFRNYGAVPLTEQTQTHCPLPASLVSMRLISML